MPTAKDRIAMFLSGFGGQDTSKMKERIRAREQKESVAGAVEGSYKFEGAVPTMEEMVASEFDPSLVAPRDLRPDLSAAATSLAAQGEIDSARQVLALGTEQMQYQETKMKVDQKQRVYKKVRAAMDTPIVINKRDAQGNTERVVQYPNKFNIVQQLLADPETQEVATGILESEKKAAAAQRDIRRENLGVEMDIYRSALAGVLTPEQGQWLQQNRGISAFKRTPGGDGLIPLNQDGQEMGSAIDVPRATAAIADEKDALAYEKERLKPRANWVPQSRMIYLPAVGKRVLLDGELNLTDGDWKPLARNALGTPLQEKHDAKFMAEQYQDAYTNLKSYKGSAVRRQASMEKLMQLIEGNPTILTRPGAWSQERRTFAQVFQTDLENVATAEALNAMLTRQAFEAVKILGGARPTDYDFIIAQRVTGSTDFSPLGLMENLFEAKIADGIAEAYSDAKMKWMQNNPDSMMIGFEDHFYNVWRENAPASKIGSKAWIEDQWKQFQPTRDKIMQLPGYRGRFSMPPKEDLEYLRNNPETLMQYRQQYPHSQKPDFIDEGIWKTSTPKGMR